MPKFETIEIRVCITCRQFLANGDLPNDFPEFHASVDEVNPDDVKWHPDHIHGNTGEYPSEQGWRLSITDYTDGHDKFSAYICEACGGTYADARWPAVAMRAATLLNAVDALAKQ